MSRFVLDGQVEIFILGNKISDGNFSDIKAKFTESAREAALSQIVDEVANGLLYLGDASKGEIQVIGIARIISNAFWCEVEYIVLFPGKNGGEPKQGTYRVVRWNVGVDCGAAALCVTKDDEIILLRQFRHAARGWRYEIPRGVRKPGETLEDCGFREALEEAGVHRTEETEVVNLGEYEPDTGVLAQKPSIVMYTNVEVDETRIVQESTEAISGYIRVPFQKVCRMIYDGEITDGFTNAAILRLLLRRSIR